MQMTLSRALRYKKRIVERIRKLESEVQENNSQIDGEERETDVRLALKQRAAWVQHLVAFKLALQEATRPIQKLVFELAETKAELSFLQRICTLHGTQRARYREDISTTYTAELRKKEVDTLTETLQKRVDDLQTKIDAHNATKQLEISEPDLP